MDERELQALTELADETRELHRLMAAVHRFLATKDAEAIRVGILQAQVVVAATG